VQKKKIEKKILKLLEFFHNTGLIVSEHMSQGFRTCRDALNDIKLDIPTAPSTFDKIVQTAEQEGWLSKEN